MTRTMYDSITAADIPAGAKMVAGYVNGTFQWSAADWARFPGAVKVRIATRAFVNDGHVLDVEPGDATPAEAPGWVKMRRAAGVDPTVYCSVSALAAVQTAFTAANVAQPHFWVAHYDGAPTVPAGCVAKQYINDPASGGHYDLSAVADYWPGVDPVPPPNSNGGGAATTTGVEIMQTITVTPPNADQNTVRVFLSGSPGAAVIVRPKIDGQGFSKPMWVGDIFAWGNDHQGIGHNPTQAAGYDNKLTSHRRYELPGALWADINYSAAEAFQIDIVG